MVNEILAAFPDARVHSGYVRIRCPYHKDGKEAKPSMSILLEPRGTAPAGFCHCFACGKVVKINQLLKDIGQNIVIDTEQITATSPKKVELITAPPILKPQLPFKKSAYLESRGISEEVQARFKVYEKDKKVYMPVFDKKGVYLYVNARSTVTKMFFVEGGAVKTLWGLEEVDLSRPVAVCESQIDAMSLWEIDMQAVATLGADNLKPLVELKNCTSTIILAFDPDEAGRRARDRAVAILGAFRCKWLDLPEGVDVNKALQDIKDKKKFKEFMLKCIRSFVQ